MQGIFWGRFWIYLFSLICTEKSLPEHWKAEGEWSQMLLLNKRVTLWSQLPWIQRLVQGVTFPWASSDRATFCHRTPVVSMDASLHEPGSLLPWILAVESISSFCTSAGARHREVLIAIWCLSKAPSDSCNSKYVVVTYLSLSNRWKLYSMILSYYFGALFLFPTL